MTTERTRLALTSMATIAAIARLVGAEYEHLQEYFLGQILKLCERTSKILFERAKSLLLEVLSACPGPTKYVVPRLGESASSANKNLRQCVIEAIGVVLKHSKKDTTMEHADTISLIIKNGLHDAAEPVRVASRTLFADFRILFPSHALQILSVLPSTVSKSLDAGQSNPSKPTLSFRAFISTKKDAGADPTKSHGPQRVASKVAPFHPYPSEPSSLKKSIRVENTKLPTRAIKPTLSAPPTISDHVHRPHRIISSASAQQLPILAKVVLPRSGSSSAITSPKRAISMDINIFPPTPKSLLYDFFEGVKRVEWNVRHKSLVDFLEIMERPDIVELMLSHRPTTGRLFEIFFGGLGDVHYKVVFLVVEFGKKLLKLIPAEKVPEVTSKTEKIINRLFYVATNIQFKAKPSLIEDAHRLVDDIIEWSAPGKRIQVLTSCKGKNQYPNVTKAIEERLMEERILGERLVGEQMLEDDVQFSTIATLQSPRKLHPEDEGSPMKGITREDVARGSATRGGVTRGGVTGEDGSFSSFKDATEEGEIIPSPKVFHDDEIVLDAELGISLRPKTMPSTPVSRLRQVVDFDTPRSMEHYTPIETDSEAEDNDLMHVKSLDNIHVESQNDVHVGSQNNVRIMAQNDIHSIAQSDMQSTAPNEYEPSGKDEQVSNIMKQLEL